VLAAWRRVGNGWPRSLSLTSRSGALPPTPPSNSDFPQDQASQSSREPRPLSWASGGRRCLLGSGSGRASVQPAPMAASHREQRLRQHGSRCCNTPEAATLAPWPLPRAAPRDGRYVLEPERRPDAPDFRNLWRLQHSGAVERLPGLTVLGSALLGSWCYCSPGERHWRRQASRAASACVVRPGRRAALSGRRVALGDARAGTLLAPSLAGGLEVRGGRQAEGRFVGLCALPEFAAAAGRDGWTSR
jgi:hypothetical protein